MLLSALCLFAPAGKCLLDAFHAGAWSDAALSSRRLVLIAKGLALSCGSALVALPLAAGLACGLCGGRLARSLTLWACLVILLTPPYVYAYAWSLVVLPEGLITGASLATTGWWATYGRAFVCLGSWSAPLAALALAGGWRISGRASLRLAALDVTGWTSRARVIAAPMTPWVGLAVCACLTVTLTEFSVAHFCLIQTWNTEILAEIQARSGASALLLSWPLLAIIALMGAAWWPARRRIRLLLEDLAGLGELVDDAPRPSRGAGGLGLVVAALAVLCPVGLFVSHLREVSAFGAALKTFPREWPAGLLCGFGAALAAGLLALGVDFALGAPGRGWRRRLLRGWAWLTTSSALVLGLAPPVLVGAAFSKAYLMTPWISDHWWIVSLLGVGRYGWIAVVGLVLASRLGNESGTSLAATDGADWASAYGRVRAPLNGPAFVLLCGVVGLLSLTDIAAAQLVTPPGTPMLSITLLNMIHFGRNDEIIAMCLYLVAFVGGLTGLIEWSRGRLLSKMGLGDRTSGAWRR